MRMLLVLIAAAAVGAVTFLVVSTLVAKDPVTKAQIEHTVAKRTRGHVQVVLCNEVVLPSQAPPPGNAHTWTCDTYVGPTAAAAQNGPSYQVIATDNDIKSIRRVPTH